MDIINNWIEGGKNFKVGAAIYQAIGSNEALKRLLRKGRSPIAEKELNKALMAMVGKPAKKSAPKPAPLEKTPAPNTKDSVIEALDAEWKPKYKLMQFYRNRLRKYGKSNAAKHINDRAQWAKKVLELEQECMVVWRRRDYYLQHGKLPDVPVVKKQLPTDPLEIGRRVENLKRYIRREGEKLKKDEKNAQAAQRRIEYLQEYKELTCKEYQENEQRKRS